MQLVDHYVPDYFIPGMLGYKVDACILEDLLAQYLPAVSCFMQAAHYEAQMLCCDWFILLYTRCVELQEHSWRLYRSGGRDPVHLSLPPPPGHSPGHVCCGYGTCSCVRVAPSSSAWPSLSSNCPLASGSRGSKQRSELELREGDTWMHGWAVL